jgi:ferredoxin
LGIVLHNIYACREIRGNKHFRGENTIESQYEMVETAKGSLSGIENHARLVMSTEYGKVEVCGIDDGDILLKLNRFVHGNKLKNTIIKVDQTKIPEGQKFYWLTDQVIDLAVSGEGKKVLMELRSEGSSLIKKLKNAAASSVISQLPQNDNNPSKSSSCDQKVTIEIINRKGGSKIIHVDLADEEYKKKPPTLATILAAENAVEAACKEQLSCSTCVGEVEGDLPVLKEDELDLVDSVIGNLAPSAAVSQIRAACQIALEPSKNYKFTDLLQKDSDKKSGSGRA